MIKKSKILRFIPVAILMIAPAAIADPTNLEIATIIPDGSDPASNLKAMSKRIADKTNGDVKIRFQWGGIAGDDTAVVAAVRDGKLNGALLAGQILSSVAPGMRDTEKLFQFGDDSKKAWAFVDKHKKDWESQLTKSGLKSLGMYEAGFVYLVGRKPFASLGDIKNMNIWSWPGDNFSHKSIAALGGKAVDIPVQDTFKALSDGRLDMAYGPPIAIVALQWSSKITHLLDQPIAFAVGSFAVSDATWKKLPKAAQDTITSEASTALTELTASTQKDNSEALNMLKSSGIKLVHLKEADLNKAKGK